jgi:hypothetical protein
LIGTTTYLCIFLDGFFFLTERIWLILHDDMGIWNQQQQQLKQHNNDNNQLFDINVYQHVISKKKN